ARKRHMAPGQEQAPRGALGRRGGRIGTKLALEDLARRVARQRLDEDEIARHLRPGEALARPSLQGRFVEGGAGPLHHERANALAPLLIRHADDRDLRKVWVLLEDALDLGRIHVHAARDDHVALAPLDEVAPLAIAPREIADAEVAVAHALVGRALVLVV